MRANWKLGHPESDGGHRLRSAELDRNPSEAEDSSRNPVSCRKTSPIGERCWVKSRLSRRQFSHLHHNLGRHLRHVDNHAKPIHLGDQFPAEIQQAAMFLRRVVELALRPRGICELIMADVGEGNIAQARSYQAPSVLKLGPSG